MEEKLTNKQFVQRAKCSNLEQAKLLKEVSAHHIESFNYLHEKGLDLICRYLAQMDIFSSDIIETQKVQCHLPFKKMRIWFEHLEIGYPIKSGTNVESKDNRLLPSECRIAGKTYGAPLLATLGRTINDEQAEKFQINLGDIPIITKSSHCHLAKLTPQQLVQHNEDCNEFGGYFIVNGNEKIIRMLILQKRNYPIAFLRPGFIQKGPNFSNMAVQAKCTREDIFSKTITLHYVNDGNIFLRILHRKQEFLIPLIVILKALGDISDMQIYNRLVKGDSGQGNLHDRIEVLLRGGKALSLNKQNECLAYLGKNFRVVLNITNPEIVDVEVGKIFIQENICVHLNDNIDKFNFLLLMTEKLYALVNNEILPDNLDSLMNQEVLLPGHLYMMILREKLEEILIGLRLRILKDGQKSKDAQRTREIQYLKTIIDQQGSISKKVEYFLSTGNLKSGTGLDLMQAKGFTIIADKLNNMRYFSHFRSIHRGAYFAEMKTTSVRKLLPEQWGFVCPVHTPDGAPCGLLNHLSKKCYPSCRPCFDPEKHNNLEQIMSSLGMNPIIRNLNIIQPSDALTVVLDGKIVGYIESEQAEDFVSSLRYLKMNQVEGQLIPNEIEIGYIPKNYLLKNPVFPGVFIATNEARFLREVRNLKYNVNEWISPFEQPYLSIACTEHDIRNDTEYQELDPADILSILPSNIPFLNYNQSPRNMYQCQMAKQTMGTPVHNFPYRFDNRLYRLITPQIPLVKGQFAEEYGLADYPSGTNACVAVISYTGYDMEDAMILNKSSYERGFGHGVVYKNYNYSVSESTKDTIKSSKYKMLSQIQSNNKNQPLIIPQGLDIDGIPPIGTILKKNAPVFSIYDTSRNTPKTIFYKDQEPGRLDGISLVYGDSKQPNDVNVQYRVRFSRNPIIGDKFSSRHGQKGVLGVLWPHVDMPFTETGTTPDVIINPHAFPSRMTIGMLLESMAGKAAAMQGKILENKPFNSFKDDDITKYFGEQLLQHGYNYMGNEVMYSGNSGEMMKVDIFFGLVYYQRLRHMVSDKSQARAIGPVDVLTQQPIKGRKKGGGIRMGEMERDALLAHGISMCIYDRFMVCSDKSQGHICKKCGSLLACLNKQQFLEEDNEENASNLIPKLSKNKIKCLNCDTQKMEDCALVNMPYVLRYLTNELAAMNIKLSFKLK